MLLSKNLPLFISIATIAASSQTHALAGACCASGGALPSLITGDDHAQFSTTVSRGSVIGDAPREGIPVFRSSNHQENLTTIQLSAATLVSDLWQAGASLPVHRRDLTRETSNTKAQGFGDAVVSVGYEALPEYDYSIWRPHGYVFSTLTVPTGTSIYTASERSQTDAFGKGFFTPGFGALFKKDFGSFDTSWLAEAHYSLGKTFNAAEEAVTVGNFWGASTQLGLGYRVANAVRVGLKVGPSYTQALRTETSLGTDISATKLVWDSTFDFTYVLRNEWALLASYTDQTLLGPVMNTSLSRTLMLGFQKSFPR